MANKGVGNTALGAACCRLIEQYQPEETRLFNDPLVKDLVGAPIKIMMQFSGMRKFTVRQTDGMTPGIFGAQICRTRYIDDTVLAGLAQGIDQLVILGAGFDTRSYRLPGIERVRAYEVDLQAVQNAKMKKLQKYFGNLPANVTYLPIDFDTQPIESVLSGTSFDLSRPAIFIWEAVTQYISEESVCQTLAFVGKSAPGSILVFTYVLKSIIERRSNIPGTDKMMDRVEKNHAPWIFGLEPSNVSEFLRRFNLESIADVGNRDYQESYLKPIHRQMAISEVERIAVARVPLRK